MNPAIRVICPRCHIGVDVPYILIGAAISCPSCGKDVVPEMAPGTAYPDTGYQITFADFKQLLKDHRFRRSIATLLSQWYGYEIAADGESISLRSSEGDNIDLLWLHRRIQSESDKQHALYQTAMAI